MVDLCINNVQKAIAHKIDVGIVHSNKHAVRLFYQPLMRQNYINRNI